MIVFGKIGGAKEDATINICNQSDEQEITSYKFSLKLSNIGRLTIIIMSCDQLTLPDFKPHRIVTKNIFKRNRAACSHHSLHIENLRQEEKVARSFSFSSGISFLHTTFLLKTFLSLCGCSPGIAFLNHGFFLFVLAQFIYCAGWGLFMQLKKCFNRFLDNKEHSKYTLMCLVYFFKEICIYFQIHFLHFCFIPSSKF